MEDADAFIIERIRAGERDEFRTLVQRHSRSVFRLAYRMTGNTTDAEEVVQETFVRAYKQLARYESRSSFSTWLFRIAANYSLDLIRMRKRHQRNTQTIESGEELDHLSTIASPEPGQDRLYQSAELRKHLDNAIRRLTEQERVAFLLRHMEGKSIEEIGTILDLGVSATKNSIFRAVRKLREALHPVVSST